MRSSVIVLTALLSLTLPALAGGAEFDWQTWSRLPVFDGGRAKPLEVLARETCQRLFQREQVTDPDTGRALDPTAAYMQLLFDWQGGQRPPTPSSAGQTPWRAQYFRLHAPDKWDQAALLPVTSPALREALGLPPDQAAVSPLALSQAKITRAAANESRPYLHWAEETASKPRGGLPLLERQALELAERYWEYQAHRLGQRLAILPSPAGDGEPWLSAATLWHSEFPAATDRSGSLRKVQTVLRDATAAYRAGRTDQFHAAAVELQATLRDAAPPESGYPSRGTIALERWYGWSLPLRWAWMLTAGAFVGMALEWTLRRRAARGGGARIEPRAGGRIAYAGGLFAAAVELALRAAIRGCAPLADMYEVLIGVGLGVLALGWLFERSHRQGVVLAIAAAIAAVPLGVADTAWVDSRLQPLPANLYYDPWLVGHVTAVALGGALLALTLGIGHVSLAQALAGAVRPGADDALTRLTSRGLQGGVLLLAAGAILGSRWAETARGTTWGADPRELWLLVALLAYLAVLHARAAGWLGGLGLAALAVLCFPVVIMAGYGLHTVLSVAPLDATIGSGARVLALVVVGAETLYVAAAVRAATIRHLQHVVSVRG